MLLVAAKRPTAATQITVWIVVLIACSHFAQSQSPESEWLSTLPIEGNVNDYELDELFTVQRSMQQGFPEPVVVPTGSGVGGQASPLRQADSMDPVRVDRSAAMQLPVRVGYDGGFTIASQRELELGADAYPYWLRINGYGQMRDTIFDSEQPDLSPDLNQLQLKRARIVFQGHAFSPDIAYFLQLDGRSNSGDNLRILDYYLKFDVGHQAMNLASGTLGLKAGLYKMPFTLARHLSGKQFEFADRSMASIYFDVNRSLAWGLYGATTGLERPIYWDLALFNGLVTGGAETGSSGTLDNNNAFSMTAYCYPTGEWGHGELADFDVHDRLATRIGGGVAFSTIDRTGTTEFDALRVVDSGRRLSSLLPDTVDQYSVALFSVAASMKYLGLSSTLEYYFRNVSEFKGASVPDLYDQGMWLQFGYFAIAKKLQLLTRWSRVSGNSGTLGVRNQEANEIAAGAVWYFREQHIKLTLDATYLDGAPINSSALDISPGDIGWLYRTQLQFSF
ncbi:hypothetical protein [Novipirellula artificiosorum]|uniref:Phosphate-selective porin O and P n=1 Tax=Novipirellula artificiosorum TaxID=2528016 RepID=A0A5C6DWP2_9BACT|nr:hypothetical protein [Novipirellula artificiosorum]TWU41833.1 Phosphate-selective porin O and P [Novipirellula artificiosorum]